MYGGGGECERERDRGLKGDVVGECGRVGLCDCCCWNSANELNCDVWRREAVAEDRRKLRKAAEVGAVDGILIDVC